MCQLIQIIHRLLFLCSCSNCLFSLIFCRVTNPYPQRISVLLHRLLDVVLKPVPFELSCKIVKERRDPSQLFTCINTKRQSEYGVMYLLKDFDYLWVSLEFISFSKLFLIVHLDIAIKVVGMNNINISGQTENFCHFLRCFC